MEIGFTAIVYCTAKSGSNFCVYVWVLGILSSFADGARVVLGCTTSSSTTVQ